MITLIMALMGLSPICNLETWLSKFIFNFTFNVGDSSILRIAGYGGATTFWKLVTTTRCTK
jgi:hypothetical protein